MSLKIKGLEDTLKELERLNKNTPTMLEDTVNAGVQIATNEMRKQINMLKTSEEKPKKGQKRYPTKKEVDGLKESLGFTPVRWNDTLLDANAGFDGYNNQKTKRYPNGHANQMIANSINAGTSFMQAQPFIRKAANAAKTTAIAEMQKKLNEEIERASQ